LHLASQKNYSSIVGDLLRYNANTSVRDLNGRTPLELALRNDASDAARVLEPFVAEDLRHLSEPTEEDDYVEEVKETRSSDKHTKNLLDLLDKLALSKYAFAFLNHDITIRELLSMTSEDFQELIPDDMDRVKLTSYIDSNLRVSKRPSRRSNSADCSGTVGTEAMEVMGGRQRSRSKSNKSQDVLDQILALAREKEREAVLLARRLSEKEAQAKKLAEQLQQVESSKACIICTSEQANCLFSPCGHVCCCVECAKQIAENAEEKARICPICRQRVRKRQKVYLV